jgi:hypothetical protein
LGETSADLITEKKIKRKLSTQLTKTSAELATERKIKIELKSQLGRASQSLVTERQAKRTRIRLLAQPKSMSSIIDATQREQRHGSA